MNSEQFKQLQIGMYVTDVEVLALLPNDYCIVKNYDRQGRIQMQPVGEDGKEKGKPYWIHYRDYDLKDKMFSSEFHSIIMSNI